MVLAILILRAPTHLPGLPRRFSKSTPTSSCVRRFLGNEALFARSKPKYNFLRYSVAGHDGTVPRCDRLPKDEPPLRIPPIISVIDDDASFRVATDSLLRARGYTVHSFASAAEFLGSPRFDETSCVITDVQMPGLSGLELQTLLRKQGNTIPMIFISAFADESARARAMRDGAICFLSKASGASTLVRSVEEALAARDSTHQ
jgi:CheY-like chemotaxis protein